MFTPLEGVVCMFRPLGVVCMFRPLQGVVCMFRHIVGSSMYV